MPTFKPKRVVLAYSGGLDTSIILRWLQEKYDCEIFTFTADLGQGDEVGEAREHALGLGIPSNRIFVRDVRDEFIKEYAMPVFRANAVYEGYYLMGTPIARPLVAKHQVDIAREVGADAVVHGATGKGNDQLRFELCYYALNPSIKVIAPWREWDMLGRSDLMAYAEAQGIARATASSSPPYSADANLLHISAEGKALEDPWRTPDEDVFTRTVSPENAPDTPSFVQIDFEKGDPVALNGVPFGPAALLQELNRIGGKNGVGRLDIVDTRYVGIKSRGVFETPGGLIWQVAHRALESITLDREEMHLKDSLVPKYAQLIYNGYWFAPERLMIQALIDKSQEHVTGSVRLKIYKGNVIVEGRKSDFSLYSQEHVTFEKDGVFNPSDATGFINVNAIRLKLLAKARAGRSN